MMPLSPSIFATCALDLLSFVSWYCLPVRAAPPFYVLYLPWGLSTDEEGARGITRQEARRPESQLW